MKIAFDGQLFMKGNKTGIAWCADNVVRKLANKNDCQCNVFSAGYSEKKKARIYEYEKYDVEIRNCNWFHDVVYKLIWPIFPLPYSWFFGNNADVTLFFNCVVPPGVKGKSVVVVHDMSYKVCPETVRAKTRYWLQLTQRISCQRADAIVTVSESSKQDIVHYLNVDPDKITVMPNGVDLSLFHNYYEDDVVAGIKKKYGINGDYFLYLGTLEPRKNIPVLLYAYQKLLEKKRESIEEVPKLVIAGGKGWLYNSIFETVKKLKIERYVIFTGYIGEEQVPQIMCGAKAFVFPSLYEGFGMPPVEAMACGTPVISSNSSSLPEVVGDAGILVNPHSPTELCLAMEQLMDDDELRRMLVSKGVDRSKKFTWESSALILCDLFQKLLGEKT